jgi:hypothetical protein
VGELNGGRGRRVPREVIEAGGFDQSCLRLQLALRREGQRHDQGGSNPRRWPPDADAPAEREMYRMSVTHRYKRLPYVIVRLTTMVIPGVGEVPETGISQRRSPSRHTIPVPWRPVPLSRLGSGRRSRRCTASTPSPAAVEGVPGRLNVGRASFTVVLGCYWQAGASALASCLGWEVGAAGPGPPPGAPDGPGPTYCSAISGEAG